MCYAPSVTRRLIPILAATLLLSAAPVETIIDFDNTIGATASGDVLAFVGTQIRSIEDDPDFSGVSIDPNTGEEVITIRMDSRWHSRFAVEDVITGDFEHSRIDFIAYDHYGQPAYTKADSAVVLYLHDLENGWHHDKYNYIPVYRTMIGDWASCGMPVKLREKRHPSDDEPPPLRRIDFASPVTFDLSRLYDTVETWEAAWDEDFSELSEEEQAEWKAEIAEGNSRLDAEFATDTFTREGDIATCHLGVPVKDFVPYEMRTHFRHDIVLSHCRTEAPKVDPNSKDRKRLWKEQGAAVQACVDRLYPSGWPYTE